MTREPTELERELQASLARRAGQVAPVRLELSRVRAAARRRRRARLTGAVAGAVLATVSTVAVLTLLLGAPGPTRPDRADRPDAAVSRTPEELSRESATPPGVPGGRPLADLPEGRAPGVGVLVRNQVIEPDGSRVEIPEVARQFGIGEITRVGSGFAVSDRNYFEGTAGLALVVDGATTPIGPCTTGAVVTAPDGKAAWVTFACPESGDPAPTVLVARANDGSTTSTVLGGPLADTTGVAAAGFVDGRVLVTRGFSGGAFLVAEDGTVDPAPSGATVTAEVSPDGNRAITASSGGVPDTVVDLPSFTTSWTRPRLVAFSPDGDLVVAAEERLQVLDAGSGRPVAVLGAPAGSELQGSPVWEDDDHLLVVARDASTRSVLRLGLDGTVDRAGEPLPYRGEVTLVP